MYNDDITVFHLEEDGTYVTKHFKDLYFEHSKGVSFEKLGENSNNSGVIIIPGEKKIEIYEKDVVIEGNITEKLDKNKRLSYLKSKYTTYEVIAVDDLRKDGLPHYEITVK